MFWDLGFLSRALFVFYISLSTCVHAADEKVLSSATVRKGYSKGDVVPVSCLNRTIETGEHITDAHGNLQYIPFMVCNETRAPLTFSYGNPSSQNCTIESLSDELYHLLEYFVHSDVPLSCRVPSYPLSAEDTFSTAGGDPTHNDHDRWTPFTIALQGTLQLSHLHLHTNINALFHTAADDTAIAAGNKRRARKGQHASHLIGSTAYSLPGPDPTSGTLDMEGTKIIRTEPLVLTFNVGWIEGPVLPGMIGRPVMKVTDHNVGFSLLTFFAIFGSAGTGALLMLVYERRKSGRSLSGLLPTSSPAAMNGVGNGNAVRGTGYGGYGGYGGYNSVGKRD